MNYIFSQSDGHFKLSGASNLQPLGWPPSVPALVHDTDITSFVEKLDAQRADKTGQFFVHIQMVDASLYSSLLKKLRAARLRPVVGPTESLKEIGHD